MGKKRTSDQYIRTQIREHRYWCEHNAEGIKEDADSRFKLHLTNMDFRAAKVITLELGMMALYHGSRGCLAVIEGDEKCWRDIDLAVRYQYWNVKMSLGAIRKAVRESLTALQISDEVPILALLLCYSYVHELVEQRDEFWHFFQSIVYEEGIVTESYWPDEEQGWFELFAYRMFASTPFGDKARLPKVLAEKPIGPYQSVLDHWDKQEDFVDAMRAICDYHCEQMELRSAHHAWAPFDAEPFDLVPYEILAIYKLRAEQGLDTPEIDHPLLKLPTASREPRELTKIDDPIFERIEKLYIEQCLN